MNGENIYSLVEVFSIIASFISILLCFFAIALSIWFFIVNRNTEKNVSNSLTKIETQANILQKITGKQLDKYTSFFTESKSTFTENLYKEIIDILSILPTNLIAQDQKLPSKTIDPEIIQLITTLYITIYFYTAQTNLWTQNNLPNPDDFDEKNNIHVGIKRIIEMSFSDFCYVADVLSKCDQQQLKIHPLNNLLTETRDVWRVFVKNSSQIYEQRAKEK